MRRHDIPTAAYAVCSTLDEVRDQLPNFPGRVVVKADGLAAGKGVVIAANSVEAEQTADAMFSGLLLGAPVDSIVLEQFLAGDEISCVALCDGRTAVPLAAAQDHKRIGEGDTGPNTGGMGAYSTDSLLSIELTQWITENIAQKVVDGMASEHTPFKGILFCGLMMTPLPDGTTLPMVIEYNVRFGDPEIQAILMRLDSDIVDLLEAVVDGCGARQPIRMKRGAAVCVIAASGGYPGKYAGGKLISGLDAPRPEGVEIFHSGTALNPDAATPEYLTAGGRVLGITATSIAGLRQALDKAYETLNHISFEGIQFRKDIGWRALKEK